MVCEYGGDCEYCLYVDTCDKPCKDYDNGTMRRAKERYLLNGDAVKAAIKNSGLTRTEVAERIGLGISSLSDRIKGKYEASVAEIEGLSTELGVPAKYLIHPNQTFDVYEWEYRAAHNAALGLGFTMTALNELMWSGKSNHSLINAVLNGKSMPTINFLEQFYKATGISYGRYHKMQTMPTWEG